MNHDPVNESPLERDRVDRQAVESVESTEAVASDTAEAMLLRSYANLEKTPGLKIYYEWLLKSPRRVAYMSKTQRRALSLLIEFGLAKEYRINRIKMAKAIAPDSQTVEGVESTEVVETVEAVRDRQTVETVETVPDRQTVETVPDRQTVETVPDRQTVEVEAIPDMFRFVVTF